MKYPTEFSPPELPRDVPKENAAEFLKNWPAIGITPTTFETRNTGAVLEIEATVSKEGRWISANVALQHARLLRFEDYIAGVLPSGEKLSIKQPQFATMKNTFSMQLHADRPALVGVHKVPDQEATIELFVLRIRVSPVGGEK